MAVSPDFASIPCPPSTKLHVFSIVLLVQLMGITPLSIPPPRLPVAKHQASVPRLLVPCSYPSPKSPPTAAGRRPTRAPSRICKSSMNWHILISQKRVLRRGRIFLKFPIQFGPDNIIRRLHRVLILLRRRRQVKSRLLHECWSCI